MRRGRKYLEEQPKALPHRCDGIQLFFFSNSGVIFVLSETFFWEPFENN